MKGTWHPDLASPLKENALHDVLINRSTPDSDFFMKTFAKYWYFSIKMGVLYFKQTFVCHLCNVH
jgi:hypothetical protein